MNTADLAVIAVTVIGLANVAANHRLQMRAVDRAIDRVRLVNPVKPPKQETGTPDGASGSGT